MIPIFQWIVAHTTAGKLRRRCPACGKTQVVPVNKLKDTVTCTSCRAPIPPPPRPG